MEKPPDNPTVELFIAELRDVRRLSEHTCSAYLRDLRVLDELRDSLEWSQLRPRHLRGFAAQESISGKSPASVGRMISAWRTFFDFLAERGEANDNPARGLRAPKSGRALPKALSPDEMSGFLNRVTGDDPLVLRDFAMFELMYSSGLRVGELVSLDDADLGGGTLRVRHGKGDKARDVPVGDQASRALAVWRKARAKWSAVDATALFVGKSGRRLTTRSVQIRISKWAAAAGLPSGATPHQLRHSCASHLLQSSGDLRAVQELLGHASIASTQIYTHLDFQALAKTYDMAHPRAKRKKDNE